jgi:putative polymerase
MLSGEKSLSDYIPACLVAASLLFNFVLCFVNTNVIAISQTVVILCEIAIVGTCMVFVSMRWVPGTNTLAALVLLCSVSWAVTGIIKGSLDLQTLRNMVIPPLFLALGLVNRQPSRLPHVLFCVHILVVVIAIWEASATSSYTSLFNVQKYYIDTRGISPDAFYNTDSDLFVSATRPDARFLLDLDIPRLSSIFLEPVSLGNYVVIIFAATLYFAPTLSRSALFWMIFGNVFLLIGTDSRFAMASLVPVYMLFLARRGLPLRGAWALLPLTIVALFALVYALGLQPGTDDFPGRLANTASILSDLGLWQFLGGHDLWREMIPGALDSGVSFSILTQGLVTFAISWVVLFSRRVASERARALYYGLACFLALAMLVSYSVASIKTASLAWFLAGQAVARGSVRLSRQAGAEDPAAKPRDGSLTHARSPASTYYIRS